MGQREKIRARKVKAKVQQRRGPSKTPPPGPSGGRGGGSSADGGRGGGVSPQRGAGRPGVKAISYSSVRGGQILVVGDGDFSFAKGLVKHMGGDGDGLVLTSYDSAKAVAHKYSNANANIEACKKAGADVMHGVDATKLRVSFPSRKFDRIIFNFPHSGEQRVHVNRALLHDFFHSARECLSDGGQAHVTLKMTPPYSEWGVEERARDAGFRTAEVVHFDQKVFPGYRHRTTEKDAKTFVVAVEAEARLCKTFCFVLRAGAKIVPRQEMVEDEDDEVEGDEEDEEEEEEEEGEEGEDDEEEAEDDMSDEEGGEEDVPPVAAFKKRSREEGPPVAKQPAPSKEAARASKKAKEEIDGASFWTADMLKALGAELGPKGLPAASEDRPEWGKAAQVYAKARNEDEIEDETLIDAALNEEEAEMFELLGVGNYLGDLGGSILSGKAGLPQAAQAASHAAVADVSAPATPPLTPANKRQQDKAGKGGAVYDGEDEDEDDGDFGVLGKEFFRQGLVRGFFYRKSCRGATRLIRAML